MPLIGKNNLEHLVLEAYTDAKRQGQPAGTFTAQINPDSISQSFSVGYDQPAGVGGAVQKQEYHYTPSSTLSCTLILDDSPALAPDSIILGPPRPTVSEQVRTFMDLAYHINSDTHQPHYLTLRWGKLDGSHKLNDKTVYMCRLQSVDINYTRFKPDGEPQRAELSITLIGDEDTASQDRAANLNSPDVTHVHVVQAGDTLPLLCAQYYGDPSYHIRVAHANSLSSLRELPVGIRLFFPPLPGKGRTQ